jgi:hypothetical protein
MPETVNTMKLNDYEHLAVVDCKHNQGSKYVIKYAEDRQMHARNVHDATSLWQRYFQKMNLRSPMIAHSSSTTAFCSLRLA